MKNFQWKKLLPHAIAVVVFMVVALVYCKPVLDGKVMNQSDVASWKAMAQNSFEYREKHGAFPLWSNGLFSGMPAFQITSVGTNPVSIVVVGNVLSLNLPKPVSFFFLACVCFYFLSQVLKTNPYVGLFGALAYAYATYNPVIISAGHDTKMQAIAYLPAFIASLLLIYNKRYLWGTALTALFTGLLVSANHLQITYYAVLIAVFMSVGMGIQWIRAKDFKHLTKAAAFAVIAALLGILVNAVSLFSTYEYSKRTIRGGSELADDKGASFTKTGLSQDYALSYSLYKTEPLVMMFPRMYGGSSFNFEVEQEKSKAIEALQQMPQQLASQVQQAGLARFYWGGIDGVGTAGPPYVGAIICFLALLGFVLLDGKYKWWILAACIFTIILSWGKYFDGFSRLMLDILPMYSKFRAPSMIIVVPTLLLPMMAIMTLDTILKYDNKDILFQRLKKGMLFVGGAFVVALLVYATSDFTADADRNVLKTVSEIQDAQQRSAIETPIRSFINGMKEDRKGLFMGDILRSLLFVVIAAGAIWAYVKGKMNALVATILVGVFAFIDVITIDTKYLNADHFVDKTDTENTFRPTPADQQIMADTGYYRVFDVSYGVREAFNGGPVTSYFHHSIGGYHPAKLSIYQDLIEKQLYNFPNCLPVIDMLNVKYVITSQQQNNQGLQAQVNPEALGPVWFVKALDFKKGPAAVMAALTSFNPKDTAVLDEAVKGNLTASAQRDSTAFIKMLFNDNDVVAYQSSSKNTEFAVFSEIYYDAGWIAKIDGKEAPIVRTNYVLRGLQVPAGNHSIVFEFKPKSFINSNRAGIGASVVIWLLLIGALIASFRKPNETA
ncbi:YfhO family protein [Sediminibacterium roseum]|uniref:YfhO family protein n=1 Tax=Sediminibacterium roseum TaxID=1978412 RepID=A0ABW9ZRI7_9BACT|nr:YfhO family protein [Sediminibacterium roseum]NCI49569.1 YfhO family protein [Sediminibacterium roseum]